VQLLNKIAASAADPHARRPRALARTRVATTAFFTFDGFVFASWAVRIPAVKAATGASPAALGVALLGVSCGAIATMALSGALCRRFGSTRVVIAACAWLSLALLLPALARSALALGAALVMFGIGYGCTNVAMNSIAVDVVAAVRRPIMPSFHAAWSLGGLAGAAVGGLIAPVLTPLPHFAIVTLLGLTVTTAGGLVLLANPVPTRTSPEQPSPEPQLQEPQPRELQSTDAQGPKPLRAKSPSPESHRPEPHRPEPHRAESRSPESPGGSAQPGIRPWQIVLLFGIMAACSTYGEGSVSDWGALRLRDLGAAAGLAATGYAAFALAEACGRLAGTQLLTRLGERRLLVGGGLTTCAGMLLVALAPSVPVAVAGFAFAGLGLANVFPAAMVRVGSLAGPNGVALTSTLGYAGFLLGPPTIGFLTGAVGLGVALTTVSALSLIGAALAWIVTQGGAAQEEPV
jgi:MFS family permease